MLRAAGVAEQHGISRQMAKAAYEAVLLISNRMQPLNYQHDPIKVRGLDNRLDAARSWWPYAATYQNTIKPALVNVRSKLMTQGVTAVALVTLRYQPALAADFWGGLALNDGLRRHDPRAMLLADFGTRRLNVGAVNQGAAAAAVAWNAFFAGRDLGSLKVYQDRPVIISGTPFDGRRA